MSPQSLTESANMNKMYQTLGKTLHIMIQAEVEAETPSRSTKEEAREDSLLLIYKKRFPIWQASAREQQMMKPDTLDVASFSQELSQYQEEARWRLTCRLGSRTLKRLFRKMLQHSNSRMQAFMIALSLQSLASMRYYPALEYPLQSVPNESLSLQCCLRTKIMLPDSPLTGLRLLSLVSQSGGGFKPITTL